MFDYARINFLFATIALVLSAIAACDIYFRAKPGKFRLSFFILLFLLSAWSSGFIMESIVLENHLFIRFIAYSMIFAGICCSGVFWLWFCLYFGQQSGKVLTKLKLFTAIPTVIILVFFITNPIHKLLYWIPNDRSMNFSSEYFYDLFFMLIHVIIGNIILIGNFLRNKKLSLIHKSILIIILSTVTSAIVLRIFLIKVVEITPLFMVAGSTLIFYLSALRYKLFNIIPASIVSFVQSMDQSILIADNRLNIVGFNNSFSNAFKHVCHINESDSLGVFAQALIKVTDDNYDTQKILKGMLSKNEKRISGHIHIRTTRDIWYSVIAQQVLNSKGKMIGRLISFNDITTIHKLSEELTDKSEKLENMNKGLKAANEEILKHTLTIEELAVTRERNRILSELHDSVGQAYTSNLALARHAETILDNQQEEALKALDEMTYITKDLLNTITYSLNNIKDKIIDRQPLEAALEVLFNAYRNSGLKIDFYSDIKNTGIKYNVRHCIYRICQESITNSLKHGMANVIKVIIETKNGRLLLNITDDGLGCNSIRKGIGLKGIENRALELNGNVDFEPSSQGGGFSVHVEIPLEKEPIV